MITDETLAQFQEALTEALAAGTAPNPDDPAFASHREYVASFAPHLVEVAIRLTSLWARTT
jgi:hypothetical protein